MQINTLNRRAWRLTSAAVLLAAGCAFTAGDALAGGTSGHAAAAGAGASCKFSPSLLDAPLHLTFTRPSVQARGTVPAGKTKFTQYTCDYTAQPVHKRVTIVQVFIEAPYSPSLYAEAKQAAQYNAAHSKADTFQAYSALSSDSAYLYSLGPTAAYGSAEVKNARVLVGVLGKDPPSTELGALLSVAVAHVAP